MKIKIYIRFLISFAMLSSIFSCSPVVSENKGNHTSLVIDKSVSKKTINTAELIVKYDLLNEKNNKLFSDNYSDALEDKSKLKSIALNIKNQNIDLNHINKLAKNKVELYAEILDKIDKKYATKLMYKHKKTGAMNTLEFADKKYSFLPILTPQMKAYVTSYYGMRDSMKKSAIKTKNTKLKEQLKTKNSKNSKQKNVLIATKKTNVKSLYFHKGLDIQGKKDNEILSSANGKVESISRNGAYGNMVLIDHGNGFKTRYAHLKKIHIDQGQNITRGQKIGLQGRTGRATGDHLHFEILFKDKRIDPMDFLWHEYSRPTIKNSSSSSPFNKI